MGSSRFHSLLLISAILLLISLPQGFGRRIKVVRHYESGYPSEPLSEEKLWGGREMVEMVMDYKEPGANTNPRSGAGFNNPPSPTRP